MPALEYCLFWSHRWMSDPGALCMLKGEWAGWAQFIGAMLALALAMWLAYDGPRKANRDARAAARAFGVQIVVLAEDLAEACNLGSQEWFSARRFAFQDALTLGDKVAFERLSADELSAFMTLRAHAVSLHHMNSASDLISNWAQREESCKSFVRQSRETLDELKV